VTTKAVSTQQHLQTERAMLVAGATERPGYGLYSYLLMPAKPPGSALQAWQDLLAVVLSDVNTSQTSEAATVPAKPPGATAPSPPATEMQRLNILYIPLLKSPNAADAKSPAWLADNYNYDLAERLLLLLFAQRASSRGPYLISVFSPLTTQRSKPLHFLHIDLTNLPDDVATSSVDLFKAEAAEPRFWEPNSAGRFVVHLAALISVTVQYQEWAKKDSDAPKVLKAALGSH
jgi:hypothetical protein